MEETEISLGKQITIFEDQELGRGTYGMVCKALYSDLPCAAKLLSPILFKFSDRAPESSTASRFNQDSKLLCAIHHPYIVQYFDVYIQYETKRSVLLMELMDESLASFLVRSPKTLPIHLQVEFCHNVIQALAYLHSNNIIHRDLTGNNVLISAGSRAKVTDHGMMKIVDSQLESSPRFKQMTTPDSIPYMPPEAFKHPPSYSNLLDIFSFGVLSLQIITREFPQPSASRVSEIERRESNFSSVEMDHVLLPIIKSCLKDRDILRPPAQHLCRKLNHLRDSRLCEDSRLKREQSLQEIDSIRKELKTFQTKNRELESQLENVRIENTQLCRLITKRSDNISSRLQQRGGEIQGIIISMNLSCNFI